MKGKKKAAALFLTSAMIAGLLMTGCGKSDQAAESTTSGYEGEVKEITIGIGNSYNPFCYLDEDGNLAGYDYEVAKAIDELLPQYEFKYEPTEFANILVGLDSDTYDIAVHHYAWNADRIKKYLYAEVPDWPGTGYVIAALPDLDIKDVSDLQGLSVEVGATSNAAYLLENYNKTLSDDKKINLIYDTATGEQQWNNILSGIVDATVMDEFTFDQYYAAFGGKLQKYGENVLQDIEGYGSVATYFIYNYGDEELQQAIDGATQQLIDDGTLAKISKKIFNKDYVTDGFAELAKEQETE